MEQLVDQNYCCAVTKIPLQLRDPVTGTVGSAFSPSLDRIDNDQGYVKGNVQIVCLMYNNAKNRFNDTDVATFAKAFLTHHSIVDDNKPEAR